jgi:ketopantoate reductase
VKKKTLIYGGGAIGSFIASCLIKSNHEIFFLCRKKNYDQIKKNGLKIKVYNNDKLIKKQKINVNKNFKIINSLQKFHSVKFNNIFITTKLTENLKKIFLNIERNINDKTLIITPCTAIPFWWFQCLKPQKQRGIKSSLDSIFLKNLNRKNLVGMTMWLSGKIEKPGVVKINHIQRGFPIKEVFLNKKKEVDELRKDILKNCNSPKIKNIYSEIFIKSINSLAFNLIALKYQQNNLELNNNLKAKKEILKIQKEGDKLLKINDIKIYQSAEARIKQTLKSKNHTMSMLNAYQNNKKIELKDLWLSLENLIKKVGIKMNYTKKTFNEIKKKLLIK